MSIRTSPRREAAIRQRNFLKYERGYSEHDIQAFADLFNTQPDEDDEPRITCAETEEDQ